MIIRTPILLTCAFALAPMFSSSQGYHLRPFDTGVPADATPYPDWINDFGDVVVLTLTQTADAPFTSYLLHHGTATGLSNPAGATYYDVNDSLELLGTNSSYSNGLLLTRNGSLTNVIVPGSTYTFGNGINNLGDVAGVTTLSSVAPFAPQSGFILHHDKYTVWNYPPVGGVEVSTNLFGINDEGDFCGYWSGTGASGTFFVDGGKLHDFSVPGQVATDTSFPYAINDWGVIAGVIYKNPANALSYGYGYVYDHGRTEKIDYTSHEPQTIQGNSGTLTLQSNTFTNVYCINNLGQIVGAWQGIYVNADFTEEKVITQPFIGEPEFRI